MCSGTGCCCCCSLIDGLRGYLAKRCHLLTLWGHETKKRPTKNCHSRSLGSMPVDCGENCWWWWPTEQKCGAGWTESQGGGREEGGGAAGEGCSVGGGGFFPEALASSLRVRSRGGRSDLGSRSLSTVLAWRLVFLARSNSYCPSQDLRTMIKFSQILHRSG